MHLNLPFKTFVIILIAPSISLAEAAWKLNASVTAVTAHYAESLTMNNQHGLGFRMSGEKDELWGFTTGLLSTQINLMDTSLKPTQKQDNWLISSYAHMPSIKFPGRWTLQLDMHQVNNDAQGNFSSEVQAIAPKVSWLSFTKPIKIDASYASSSYKNLTTIHQFNTAIAYGFNESNDWIQISSYSIKHLDNAGMPSQAKKQATDVKLTHIFKNNIQLSPTTVTLGVERGKRMFIIDMATQTLNNLPMLNEGGESISANWKLSSKTDLNLQLNRTRYFADAQYMLAAHRFTLNTMSAQIATSW
jgi:hypothetical protein